MTVRARFMALASCLLATAASNAQAPAPRKVFTNKALFTVPLRIEEADRAKIAGLKCYVKTPGGVWQLHESGSPQTGKFTYQANVDGEYGFAFSTLDGRGLETPPRPDMDGPKLFVVVDTQPPEFTATTVPVASGQAFVQCTMKDAHPDATTITAEAEQADGTFVPLVPLDKDTPGFFRAPNGTPARLRVTGKDKAGNPAVQIVSLTNNNNSSTTTTPTMVVPQPLPPIAEVATPKPAPIIVEPTVSRPAPISTDVGMPKPVMPEVAPLLAPRVAEKPPEPPPASPAEQIVNTPRVVLNYAIDGINPASVQRVEAYLTRDEGKSWQRLCEDPDRTSPIEIILPGDGKFGIQLVVSTGGRTSPAPAAGEQPDWWVEVDTTVPLVTIENATPGVGEDAGLLLLQWSVKDKNPKPDAVEVFWAHLSEGPWQPIAKGLRADGQYRWPIPREAGGRVFLKVEAADRAGNVGRAITPQAVALETGRPRARVLGINPAAMRP